MKEKDIKGNFSVTLKKGGKVFWGVFFLLGAVAFLVSKLGFFEGVGFLALLFSIGLLAILIHSLVRRSFGGILFSLAFLVIVNDGLLHLEAITPWPVLGAALLGTIGLNILFPKFPRPHREKNYRGGISENRSGDVISYENAFGSAVKYVVGEIAQVNLDNAFGTLEVYFSDAVLKNHTARVHIDSAFGKVSLYVPEGWRVINDNMEQTFCSVDSGCRNDTMKQSHSMENDSMKDNTQEENILYVSGDVSFGMWIIRTI